jgi:hypothetical protein
MEEIRGREQLLGFPRSVAGVREVYISSTSESPDLD